MRAPSDSTIAAIATAVSDAGIGIIRISGPDAVSIADAIFVDGRGCHSLSQTPTHRIRHGWIVEPRQSEPVDEVLVSIMRAPHSYTTEDVAEINCHGGRFVMGRVLELVLSQGARLAEPGEVTKRAFMGGRIDLAQAEAVMDIISSQNELSLKNSERQLSGVLSRRIIDMRGILLHESARIEAALDDPDVYDLDDNADNLLKLLDGVRDEFKRLITGAREGRILTEGIDTVILGPPNAGKSSLFNYLTGDERAIVTDIPGTTRDILETPVRLGEVVLRLIDTAGLRETDDPIESIGVERALERAEAAQLILYVLDSADLPAPGDIPYERLSGRKWIILLNKTDLSEPDEHYIERLRKLIPEGELRILPVSVRSGCGMDALKSAIMELFIKGDIAEQGEYCLTSIRHEEAVKEALADIERAMAAIGRGESEELYCADIMGAYHALGRIIGAEPGEDLFDEIFSAFCMGK